MIEQKPSRMEQILHLLIEEIEERIAFREKGSSPSALSSPAVPETGGEAPSLIGEPAPAEAGSRYPELEMLAKLGVEPGEQALAEAAPVGQAPLAIAHQEEMQDTPLVLPEENHGEGTPATVGPSHVARLMRRLAFWVLIGIVLINIPLNRHGLTLANAMPDAASYIVREGFVVKEEDDPEIYVYEGGKFRWISSLDAFEHYGYTWGDVHVVPDGYLDKYEIGTPKHVLLKCADSPHIYRLENQEKRWIRDIAVFLAEGHVWKDVRFVSCQYLRDLPDGETIPPDSGPPPQP